MDCVDAVFMREAIEEAKKAYEIGEVPIGAVVVKDGQVIGRGYNQIESKKDVTTHAEMMAIRDAEKNLGGWRLNNCTIYVSAEPCTMCAGAIVLSRIKRMVTGAASPKSGACFTLKNLLSDERLNHNVELTNGILEEECSELLKSFFNELRVKNKKEI